MTSALEFDYYLLVLLTDLKGFAVLLPNHGIEGLHGLASLEDVFLLAKDGFFAFSEHVFEAVSIHL